MEPMQPSTDDDIVFEHSPIRPLRTLALADAIGFASAFFAAAATPSS